MISQLKVHVYRKRLLHEMKWRRYITDRLAQHNGLSSTNPLPPANTTVPISPGLTAFNYQYPGPNMRFINLSNEWSGIHSFRLVYICSPSPTTSIRTSTTLSLAPKRTPEGSFSGRGRPFSGKAKEGGFDQYNWHINWRLVDLSSASCQ